jgi:hypothetical protein
MLNLMDVAPGQHIALRSGAICEVVENIGDGIWVQTRVVRNAADPSTVGTEELVHCEEVVGLADSAPDAGGGKGA